jgi:hypothetical protein
MRSHRSRRTRGNQFLTTFSVTVPAGTAAQAVEDTEARAHQ